MDNTHVVTYQVPTSLGNFTEVREYHLVGEAELNRCISADARLAEEEARRRQELAALEATRDETAGRIAKLRKLLGMK